jgi:ribosome maturation protein Sdo1
VADKERKVEYDNLFRDVASVLVEKCVNPDTNRPYTITMLERALRDVHFNLDPKKAAKQQALEVSHTENRLKMWYFFLYGLSSHILVSTALLCRYL